MDASFPNVSCQFDLTPDGFLLPRLNSIATVQSGAKLLDRRRVMIES